MNWFSDVPRVFLYRDVVDFRKAVNGLAQLVEQELGLNPYDGSLYVFCNGRRDTLKILHFDSTGFVLWYKRLEEAKFVWPRRHDLDILEVNEAQLKWLLSGIDILQIKPHKRVFYEALRV